MTAMSSFFSGINAWFKAWRFIFKHNLGKYFLYPIAISILLSMGMLVAIKNMVELMMELIHPKIEISALNGTFFEKIIQVFSDSAKYAAAFALAALSLYFYNRFRKYIVLIIMSPLMALLGERVDEILTGQKTSFSTSQLLKDVLRGIGLSVRNLILELTLVSIIWLITIYLTIALPALVFLITPVSGILTFFVGSYFYGFSLLDYRNERNKLTIKESIRDIRDNRGLATGLGTSFSILFLLPYAGVTIATVTCTVAAEIAKHEKSLKA